MKLIPTSWGRMSLRDWLIYKESCKRMHKGEKCIPGRNHGGRGV